MSRTDPGSPERFALRGVRRRVRVLSYGGGLDSFAMLLDSIDRATPPQLVVFADVGDPEGLDPAEWPETYDHIRDVAKPICAAAGIEFVWLDTRLMPIRGRRSLFDYYRHKSLMPARTSRLCTSAAKVERITSYLAQRFGLRGTSVEVWIGFEAGEQERAERDPHAIMKGDELTWRLNRFPLIERRLCRCRCDALVRRLGFPVPPKSACVYCPFGSRGDFQRLAIRMPGVFEQVQTLEDRCRTTKSGKIIRFGYRRGDDSDPRLSQWIAPPYRPRLGRCSTCGRNPRVAKIVGCAEAA